MDTLVDRNGALWTKTFTVPSGDQIYPWHATSTRYLAHPLVQAFTEPGLSEAVNAYALGHVVAAPGAVDEPVKALVDAQNVRWILTRTNPDPGSRGPWRGHVNTAAYGMPQPDFTAATEPLLRTKIAAYVATHPVQKPPPGGGGAVPPIVLPAGPPKPAAGGGLGVVLIGGLVAALLLRK